MIIFILFLYLEPEDSNNLYLIDRILTVPEERYVIGFDSIASGFYTNQGCLDLLNWYIDLSLKHEFMLSKWLGIRYEFRRLGDYNRQINRHSFEPIFKIGKHRLHLLITPEYYKGGDEIGIGYSTSGDYLNYLQFFLSMPGFDRNFSLRFTPDSVSKYRYKRFPFRLAMEFRRRWNEGYLKFHLGRTLPSFEVWEGHESIRSEDFSSAIYLTSWHGRFNIGFCGDYNEKNSRSFDIAIEREFFGDSLSWLEVQPWIGFKINKKFTAFFHYRVDSKSHFLDDFDYKRGGNAQYLDINYQMSDKHLWHFGYQGEYARSGQVKIVNNHRFILGYEFSFPKGKLVLWEGIEADRPFRIAKFHNHTYLSLLVSF